MSHKIIFLFLIFFSFLFSLNVSIQNEVKPGEIIKITFTIDSKKDQTATVFVNHKQRNYYQDQTKKNTYFFFDGFDIQYHVKKWHLLIKTQTKQYQKIIYIEKKKKKKPKGFVNLPTPIKKKLSLNRKKSQKENEFFHPFFLKEDRFQRWVGKWKLPVSHVTISSHYGKLRLYNTQKTNYHRGIDFKKKNEGKVMASNHGKVIYVGEKRIRGKIILINHGCFIITSYWHLSAIKVKQGQVVKKGQVIGLIGESGLATGPHLHWEVRVKDNCINGLGLLRLN